MRRLMWLLALVATSAGAQGGLPPQELPHADSTDDIIVQALRIPREKLPTGVYWNYFSMLNGRIRRENAQMFMRCALRSGERNLARDVVDGEPNSATARFAQGWIIERHKGCYPPARSTGIMNVGGPTTVADIGNSPLDRGVIVESVLKAYAPDAALTPAITGDGAVRQRFRAREGVRNRLRLPGDRDSLVMASCLVEHQPVLATRLIRSMPGSKLEQGLTQAIFVEGRGCLNGVSQLTLDPTITRTYIVDAFYRWLVAARNVDSLIPVERQG